MARKLFEMTFNLFAGILNSQVATEVNERGQNNAVLAVSGTF